MPSRVFYGNEHYYVFFRLHQYLYDRCVETLQRIRHTTCITTAIVATRAGRRQKTLDGHLTNHAGYASRTHAATKSRGTWAVAAATMQRARASRPRSIVPHMPGECSHLPPLAAGTPAVVKPP